jgi:cell shape-determining protein MreC
VSEETSEDEDLRAEIERLRQENEALKQKTERGMSLKVSAKGAVSLYGLGRFPVTLYKEQWTRVLDMADEIRAFIVEHDGELKTKGK